MGKKSFDISKHDSQATDIRPVSIEKFDIDAYVDYDTALTEKCRIFTESDSGVLVYRRMRVAEVFSYGCRDIKRSFEWQLGALKESMKYKADVPNFLEPWYGIGTAASAFGIDYEWAEGQAPAFHPPYQTVDEALSAEIIPVENTPIGKHTLDMISYFMDKTKGRIPISFTDLQSPLNVATGVVDINTFMTDLYLNPDGVKKLLDRISDLIIEFLHKQEELTGVCRVKPGHGFASSKVFEGLGMSDDNMLMLPGDLYFDMMVPSFEKTGIAFGGPVFHSCGKWGDKIETVKKINHLKMADAAFSIETDPDPNNPEIFGEAFRDTGVILNARIVGDIGVIEETVKKLWKPGLRLIVVTYCKSTEEQEIAYNLIHKICT